MAVQVDLLVVQVGQQQNALWLQVSDIVARDDVAKAVGQDGVHWRVGLHSLAFVQLEDVEVIVQHLVFFVLPRARILDQVVPDFYNIIIIINVAVDESIKAGLESSNQGLEHDFSVELQLILLNVEDFEPAGLALIICEVLAEHSDLLACLVDVERGNSILGRLFLVHRLQLVIAEVDVDLLDFLAHDHLLVIVRVAQVEERIVVVLREELLVRCNEVHEGKPGLRLLRYVILSPAIQLVFVQHEDEQLVVNVNGFLLRVASDVHERQFFVVHV